ncbi:MAG: V-type ATP synthase subunit D [bacterium]|jgi:V/A-type H+-transporting ATPase subunit D
MARYEVAPTRTNLLRLKSELAFADEGYELLEQKREILVVELKRFTARAIEAQRRVDDELARAYAALKEAELASGMSGVNSSARAVNVEADINLRMRRVMGVSIPAAKLDLKDNLPYFGPQATSVWTDEAIVRFKNALAAISQLAEARISVIRLAREIQKTIRRVNALEHVFLPDYNETIKYVEDSLEEADRESFFMTRLVRDRLEARRR